jgi:Rod binding domain-containing protein
MFDARTQIFFWRPPMMDSVTGLAPSRLAAHPTPERRVARQLESTFASEMLRAARPQKREGMFDGGTGAGAFDSFMDNAMGDAMVQRGGFGLTSTIESLITGRANRGASR